LSGRNKWGILEAGFYDLGGLTMFQADQVLHDRYQLQKRLGQTAAGHQTWLAHDRDTVDRPVVIKLLVFNPDFNWDDLKLFEREAKVLEHLDHPQIPRYCDFFVADVVESGTSHWWALVQEFVPGVSLQDLFDQGHKFAPDKIRAIALEVLDILTYLHQLSPPVLHRDIKPSNIILGDDDKIHLIDFGAVQDQAKVTGMTFTIVGTIGYAPMEQFWGRSVPASDLYGLGTTLIHLITGIPPADLPQRDMRLQFADKIGNQAIATNWLVKMVEPAIEHRYRSAKSAHKDLLSGIERKPRKRTPNWVLSIISPNEAKFVKPLFSSMQVEKPGTDLIIQPSRTTRLSSSRITRQEDWQQAILNILLLVTMVIAAATIKTHLTIAFGLPLLLLLLLGVVTTIKLMSAPQSAGLRFADRAFEIFQHKVTAPSSKILKSDCVGAIRFVSAQETDFYAISQRRKITYWQLVIRTDTTYILPWKLSEKECLWLVQEIHDWLDQHHQSHND
jgi:serine/threonine protein kinase